MEFFSEDIFHFAVDTGAVHTYFFRVDILPSYTDFQECKSDPLLATVFNRMLPCKVGILNCTAFQCDLRVGLRPEGVEGWIDGVLGVDVLAHTHLSFDNGYVVISS